ncbi:MAG: DUF309 domain-containing protein [Rhizobiaceae bacterium]
MSHELEPVSHGLPLRRVAGGGASDPAAALALPERRYLPGKGERHAEDAFDSIKALCPRRTDDAGARANVAWRYGLRLVNAGFHWEAHEVLETVWMRAAPNSRERSLVRAVIHIANGALKTAIGKPAAAARLAGLARECVADAFAGERLFLMGLQAVDLEALCDALAAGETLPALKEEYEI